MKVKKLILEKFKKVDRVEIDLDAINVLVGGNNAGKSSVLQGVHFSVIAAVASRDAGKATFTQDSLLYCPAQGFEALRHGTAYTNQTHFGHLRMISELPDEPNAQFNVKIYRGRNGNVGCERWGSTRLSGIVSSADKLFSIFVPGLAGVPQVEQFRTESVIRRGVASGDANLYLRNVLLLIKEKKKLPALTSRMQAVFPRFSIAVRFDPRRDVYIDAQVSTTGPNGRYCPLELAGTGVLQALQIFSYVTLFEPELLLLDEPDSHLHPDNQGLLASALQVVAAETTTQAILSTHSRHLVDALHEDSNFVWLKDGKVFKQGPSIDRLPLLMDLGALDRFDSLFQGNVGWVFLTEDRNSELLKILLARAGFAAADCLVISYKTSSNLEAAKILGSFVNEVAPNTKVVIHRDRDFMTDEEAARVSAGIAQAGAIPYITEGSDLEDHFVRSAHVAARLNVGLAEVEEWIAALAQENHNALQHSFTRKRDEIKRQMYRDDPDQCPDTLALLGNQLPLAPEKRLGKAMMRLIRARMHERWQTTVNLLLPSPHIDSARLDAIRAAP